MVGGPDGWWARGSYAWVEPRIDTRGSMSDGYEQYGHEFF
jgi:hypothetical protein